VFGQQYHTPWSVTARLPPFLNFDGLSANQAKEMRESREDDLFIIGPTKQLHGNAIKRASSAVT